MVFFDKSPRRTLMRWQVLEPPTVDPRFGVLWVRVRSLETGNIGTMEWPSPDEVADLAPESAASQAAAQ